MLWDKFTKSLSWFCGRKTSAATLRDGVLYLTGRTFCWRWSSGLHRWNDQSADLTTEKQSGQHRFKDNDQEKGGGKEGSFVAAFQWRHCASNPTLALPGLSFLVKQPHLDPSQFILTSQRLAIYPNTCFFGGLQLIVLFITVCLDVDEWAPGVLPGNNKQTTVQKRL